MQNADKTQVQNSMFLEQHKFFSVTSNKERIYTLDAIQVHRY